MSRWFVGMLGALAFFGIAASCAIEPNEDELAEVENEHLGVAQDALCAPVGNSCGSLVHCCSGAGLTCCSNTCRELDEDASNCGMCGRQCGIRVPICIAGLCCPILSNQICDNHCSNSQTDEDNCGGCGNACGSGQTCVNGSCVNGCYEKDANGKYSEMLCGGNCVPIAQNCGGCGNDCTVSNPSCSNGDQMCCTQGGTQYAGCTCTNMISQNQVCNPGS